MTIQIAAVDDSVPELLVNNAVTSLHRVTGMRGLSHTLGPTNLRATDKDTPDNLIIYWLIDRPEHGQILKGDNPVTMWTQGMAQHQQKLVMSVCD